MNKLTFKIYVGKNKKLVCTTNNIVNALREYFMNFKENSAIEIWQGRKPIGEYRGKSNDLDVIIHDLKDIIQAV